MRGWGEVTWDIISSPNILYSLIYNAPPLKKENTRKWKASWLALMDRLTRFLMKPWGWISSLIHARNQTVRLGFCAPASEPYGGSSRPHFENPWVGLSQENYSSPTSGLAGNQVPKPAGLRVHIFSTENVYWNTPGAWHQTQPRLSLQRLSPLHAQSSAQAFILTFHRKRMWQAWKLILPWGIYWLHLALPCTNARSCKWLRHLF